MPRKKPITTDLTQQSVALAEFAAKALVAAEQLHVKKKPVLFGWKRVLRQDQSGDGQAGGAKVPRIRQASLRELEPRIRPPTAAARE